ncbi:glycosyltransferase family 25 protein [Candidatus Halocynthiibacter alkanivorans]|uniref:glycosyltransferase family 25 protein n=1 Tax=Candidatus Halocynthiibacter alkanivorans TaxID=2267619 RepID=UPI000DF3A54D|nr:glycosyltransferase family 25 protein [Candidatus Halocynthiibacter alkanivorans]
MTGLKTYILHLPRSRARKQNVDRLMNVFGGDALVHEGVDGEQLTRQNISEVMGDGFAPRYPFTLRRGEIAAFLSHRACWKRILDEGVDAALVIEDDVFLNTRFDEALELSRRSLGESMLIRFPVQNRERPDRVLATRQKTQLFRPRVIGLGMQAQLVTRGAAERLLETSNCFDRPVDTFIQARWLHEADVLSVWPSGVTEMSADLGGSLIGETKGVGDRISRELRRPIYRAIVALKSRRNRA